MATVFGKSITYGGSFSADGAVLTLGADAVISMQLSQNISVQYSMAVQRLYDLSSTDTWFIGGRTQGQATLGRIIGPAAVNTEFIRRFGDMGSVQKNKLSLKTNSNGWQMNPNGLAAFAAAAAGAAGGLLGANQNAQGSYDMNYCLMTALTISVAAEQMLITDQTTLMFGDLDIS